MDYEKLECHSCSAPLSAIEKAGRISCEYCGSVIIQSGAGFDPGGNWTQMDRKY